MSTDFKKKRESNDKDSGTNPLCDNDIVTSEELSKKKKTK